MGVLERQAVKVGTAQTKADPSQAYWPASSSPPPCGRQLGRAEHQLLDPNRVPTKRA